MVRGQVTTARSGDSQKTYAELLTENERLRQTVSQLSGSSPPRSLWSSGAELARRSRSAEEALFDPTATRKRNDRTSWEQIKVPARSTSEILVAHDEEWNSWIHYAINYQTFVPEHESFFADLGEGRALQGHEPSWLALYFSVLSVGCHFHQYRIKTLTVGAIR